jgi:hypothetical protein
MKQQKLTKLLPVLTTLGLLFSGCYPDRPDYIDAYDLVITNYDNTFTFKGNNTYAIPDSVLKITGNVSEGDPPVFVKEPYNSAILNKIKEDMSIMGYTLVTDTSLADLILLPTAAEVLYADVYYDYYYYWDWWYYDPYYYGWYYPYPMVTTYSTGSLLLNLMSIRDVTPSGKLRVVWSALANGLLDNSKDISRVTKAIDQAFTQSTYLHQ